MSSEQIIYFPTRARWIAIQQEVPDYAYVDGEEPPDLSHGIVWAHSITSTPHRSPINDMLMAIDIRIEQLKRTFVEQWGTDNWEESLRRLQQKAKTPQVVLSQKRKARARYKHRKTRCKHHECSELAVHSSGFCHEHHLRQRKRRAA